MGRSRHPTNHWCDSCSQEFECDGFVKCSKVCYWCERIEKLYDKHD